MTRHAKGKARATVTGFVAASAFISASCTESPNTLVAPAASHSEDCIICEGGEVRPPAYESRGWRVSGSGAMPSEILPDPNATGPMTSSERERFGEPDAFTTIHLLADTHLTSRTAEGEGGIQSSG
jgi:hypothetical protein